MPKILLFVFAILISLVLLQENITSVKSAVTSCSVSLDTHTLTTNTSGDLNFTVTNTDSSTYRWVRFTAPNSEYQITGVSGADWAQSYTSSQATYTSGTLTAGNSKVFNLTISAQNISSSQNWIVQVSDASNGSGAISCTGDTSTSIGEAVVPETLSIDEISTSSITSSSITISWTTSIDSTGVLEYGTTTAYGSSASSSTLSTSHSVSLSSLTANTTYHFKITSTDESANELVSPDYTFTTSTSGSSSTTTTTVTKTVVATPTPTPIPTPDRVAPKVSVATNFSKSFISSPKISGEAVDVNSKIQKMEYSIDGKKNWIKIDIGENPGRKVAFEFQPEFLEDGNYDLLVRATDASKNIGYSVKKTFVIDRLPPMVGGSLFSVGPQVVNSTQPGYIRTIVNVPMSIAMSAIGGPIGINFISGSYSFPLKKSEDAGLWFGNIKLDKPGFYQMIAESIDGAGNKTEQQLNYFEVTSGGRIVDEKKKPIQNARIEVFYKDYDSQSWILWNGDSYEQKNPQTTGENGEFSMLLPPGTYFVKIKGDGYRRLSSKAFTIETPTVFNPTVTLKNVDGVKIGKFLLSMPQLIDDSIELFLPSSQALPTKSVLNSEVPLLTLRGTDGQVFDPVELRGKKNIVSFIGLWSPPSIEQFAEFEKAIAKNPKLPVSIIAVHETATRAKLFLERGNYQSKLFVDPDGVTVDPFGVFSYPSNYVVDKSGKVISIIRHIIGREEIIDLLEN